MSWHLIGGPCEGVYEATGAPERVRAVHGDGPVAVLDLPEDEPSPLETVVEYRLIGHGIVCQRSGKGRGCRFSSTYVPADWPDAWAYKAFRGLAAMPQRGEEVG